MAANPIRMVGFTSSRRLSFVLIPLLLIFWVASSPAQERPSLTRGDRVRVWIPSHAVLAQVASVDSVTESGLVLRFSRLPFPLTVVMDSIARLDVRGPGGSVLGGAAIGGLVGLAAGLAVSAGVYARPCSSDTECEILFIGSPPAGVLIGVLFGGLLAADPWVRVWTPD